MTCHDHLRYMLRAEYVTSRIDALYKAHINAVRKIHPGKTTEPKISH